MDSEQSALIWLSENPLAVTGSHEAWTRECERETPHTNANTTHHCKHSSRRNAIHGVRKTNECYWKCRPTTCSWMCVQLNVLSCVKTRLLSVSFAHVCLAVGTLFAVCVCECVFVDGEPKPTERSRWCVVLCCAALFACKHHLSGLCLAYYALLSWPICACTHSYSFGTISVQKKCAFAMFSLSVSLALVRSLSLSISRSSP